MQVTNDILKLAQYQIAQLHKAGLLNGVDRDDPDVLQEALLAGWKASQTYDAEKGKLSTWLLPRIRGAILDYVKKAANKGMGGKDAVVRVDSLDAVSSASGADTVDDSEDDSGEYGLTYEDTGYAVPAFFAEPGAYLDTEQLHRALARLGHYERSLLASYYGIGKPQRGLRALARQYRLSTATIARRIRETEETLRQMLKSRDT